MKVVYILKKITNALIIEDSIKNSITKEQPVFKKEIRNIIGEDYEITIRKVYNNKD